MTDANYEGLLERLLNYKDADDIPRTNDYVPHVRREAAAAIRELRAELRDANLDNERLVLVRDSLRAELEAAHGEYRHVAGRLEATLVVLRTANEHIYGGLWIDHSVECTLGTSDTAPCTCGLSDWIKALHAALAGHQTKRIPIGIGSAREYTGNP